MVITDIPSGSHSQWVETQVPDPVWAMLEALLEFISPKSMLAVAADKKQEIHHEKYQQLEKLQIGKRQVVFLEPLL
jgi:hypothetical protein